MADWGLSSGVVGVGAGVATGEASVATGVASGATGVGDATDSCVLGGRVGVAAGCRAGGAGVCGWATVCAGVAACVGVACVGSGAAGTPVATPGPPVPPSEPPQASATATLATSTAIAKPPRMRPASVCRPVAQRTAVVQVIEPLSEPSPRGALVLGTTGPARSRAANSNRPAAAHGFRADRDIVLGLRHTTEEWEFRGSRTGRLSRSATSGGHISVDYTDAYSGFSSRQRHFRSNSDNVLVTWGPGIDRDRGDGNSLPTPRR